MKKLILRILQTGLKAPFIKGMCLQKLINIMGNSGGGTIFLPFGTYRMPKMRDNIALVGKSDHMVSKVKKMPKRKQGILDGLLGRKK